MSRIKRLLHLLELIYWKREIYSPEIRKIFVWQTNIICVSFIIGIGTFFYSKWMIWFSIVALISLWNFYMLVKQVMKVVNKPLIASLHISFLINTTLRILITCLLGYIALVNLRAPALAVLLGFCSIIICILGINIKALFSKKQLNVFHTDCEENSN
ncbi:hypothetical protein BW722_05755 [Lawsonia intracellularis]|uniref:ATP synthase subunit I n=1 Tax=Lawsonia intracellularis TaxID=29546 RepID=UPI000975530C|nr:ATP synthase subunit I [Lawsonia intracellularis]OMQ02299.1 hypothetical protein BW722_05755 [Lawsonia intracellularis]